MIPSLKTISSEYNLAR